jgi:hypothetical protein
MGLLLVKARVQISLCLTKHHAMKTYWRSGGIAQCINLGIIWRWVESFKPRPLYSRGKNHGTHWTGGWGGGPCAGLDIMAKRRKSNYCPCRELNPGRPARRLVSILTQVSRLLLLFVLQRFAKSSWYYYCKGIMTNEGWFPPFSLRSYQVS